GAAGLKEEKDPGGVPLALIDFKGEGPAMGLVGDTDFLIAGFPASRERAKQFQVLQEVLEIRQGKKTSLDKGTYAKMLKSWPAQSTTLLIGDLPERWRGELAGRGSPFRSVPQHFNLKGTRTARGLDIRLHGAEGSAREARDFVKSVEKLKQMGVEELHLLGRRFEVDARTIEKVQDAVTGVQLKTQDALLIGSAVFSKEAGQALM